MSSALCPQFFLSQLGRSSSRHFYTGSPSMLSGSSGEPAATPEALRESTVYGRPFSRPFLSTGWRQRPIACRSGPLRNSSPWETRRPSRNDLLSHRRRPTASDAWSRPGRATRPLHLTSCSGCPIRLEYAHRSLARARGPGDSLSLTVLFRTGAFFPS